MHNLLMTLLWLAAAFVLLAAAVIWHRWTVYLHIRNKVVSIEVLFLGKRRKIRRSGERPKNDAAASKETAKEKTDCKKKSWMDTFSEDKKRIYDEERGGFQPSGFYAVVEEYIGYFKKVREMLRCFLCDTRYKIAIPSLRIRLDYGTGDPAYTGMLYGGIWSATGTVYPLLCRYFVINAPQLEVTPDYNGSRLDFELKGIIKVRPAHIIHAAIKQAFVLVVAYCYKHLGKGSGKHG